MNEFRMFPVVRWIVTQHYDVCRYDGSDARLVTDTIGEFESEKAAQRVLDSMIASGGGVAGPVHASMERSEPQSEA